MKTLNEILFNQKLSDSEFKELLLINQEILNYIFEISKKFLDDIKKDGKPYSCKWNNYTFPEKIREQFSLYGQRGKSLHIKALFKYYGLVGLCGRGIIGDNYMDDWTAANAYRLSGFAVSKPSGAVCKEIARMCGFKKVGLVPIEKPSQPFVKKSLITSFKITM